MKINLTSYLIALILSSLSCSTNTDRRILYPEPTPKTKVIDSTTTQDNLLSSLITDKLRPPLDSSTAKACIELIENSLSVSNKLIASNLQTTPEGSKFISVGLAAFVRATNLLDSSRKTINKDLWKNYQKIKENYEEHALEFYQISIEYFKSEQQ